MGTVYNCSACGTLHTTQLVATALVVCKSCGEVVFTKAKDKLSKLPVPPDWSFIQLGTGGQFQGETFTIVGRVRLQLRNDYKNFWCAATTGGKQMWLMESFASAAIFTVDWNTFNKDARALRAGQTFKLGDKKVMGEYVEKCERVTFEGELGAWPHWNRGFFLVQASNSSNDTAVFTISDRDHIEYLKGTKVNVENLQLTNVILWDEWK